VPQRLEKGQDNPVRACQSFAEKVTIENMSQYWEKHRSKIPEVDLLTLIFEVGDGKPSDLASIDCEQPSVSLTRGQMVDLTEKLSYGLRNHFGIGKNGPGKDAVLVVSSGQVVLPVGFYGVIAAGGVSSNASTSFNSIELARQISQGEVRTILCSSDVLPNITKAAKECDIPDDRIVVMSSIPQFSFKTLSGVELLSENNLPWTRIADRTVLDRTRICLLYSSGTTGVPKGMKLTYLFMLTVNRCQSHP
jgi:4-coumarate--CoA ligase